MQSPIVNIFKNPFSIQEKETCILQEGELLIEFLQKEFPKGFKKRTKIFVNNKELNIVDYDVKLKNSDIVDIKIYPSEPIAIVFSIYSFISTLSKLTRPNNNLDVEASLDQPDLTSSLKQQKSSPTYDLREQSNLIRLNEPIPTQYGKMRWFPDLAAQPYTRFENNLAVTKYVFSLGHGQHEINDILYGEISVKNNENISYEIFNPGSNMDSFNDNIKTLPDIRDLQIASAVKSARYETPTGFTFNKAAKTITAPDSDQAFTNIFKPSDEIRIIGPTAFEGTYVIAASGVTDTVLTLVDTSAWTSASGTSIAIIAISAKTISNPFYAGLDATQARTAAKFFMEGCYSGIFEISNPYKERIFLEFDFERPSGHFLYNATTAIVSPLAGITGYFIPVDENGDPKNHYEVDTTATGITMSLVSGNTYNVPVGFRAWKNNDDLSDIIFPTVSDYTLVFTENNVPISSSDISSIDYVNGSVTFNTSKSGTIRVKNTIWNCLVYFNETSGITGLNSFLQAGGSDIASGAIASTLPIRVSTQIDVFRPNSNREFNMDIKYKCVIYPQKWSDGKYISDAYAYEDDLLIRRIKVIYPSIEKYPSISLLATSIIASPNLDLDIDNKINIISTRKLPTWDGDSFTALTTTRSIAWALADVWMSTYGASRPYSSLDLDKLLELDEIWTDRGDTFDGLFDSSITVWEALVKIARAGRAKPIFDGTKLTFVRDQEQEIYTAVFTPDNILPDSFSIEYTFDDEQAADGVIIKYIDEDANYTAARVQSSENLSRPKEIDFFGCVNYEMAWRESQYMKQQLKRQKSVIRFSTEMVGHIPFYGDLISVQYDLPDWGQSGLVTSKSGVTIQTNQPLDFSGSAPFYISFMKPNGSMSGPHEVTEGSNEFECILDVDVVDFTFITERTNQNPTIYQFGPSSNWHKPCIVTSVIPRSDNETMEITCIPYIEAVYTADEGTPPDKPSIVPSGNPIPPKVSGLQLSNVPGSGEVIANWNPAVVADTYKVQKSTDNSSWSDVSTPTITTETISATGTLYVRVACVIDSFVGDYVKSVIVAS